MNRIYDLPVMRSHPRGVSVGKLGDAENMAELSDGFAQAMKFGLMMVYAVLVLQQLHVVGAPLLQ